MYIYRSKINVVVIMFLIFALFSAKVLNNQLITMICVTLFTVICGLVFIEAFIGGQKMRYCLKYITRRGYEIHVSDEANGDPVLYHNLVGQKILKSLELGHPAYIVAHTNIEKNLLENIPQVKIEEGSPLLKFQHFHSISVYHPQTRKKKPLQLRRRFKDITRRWNYGCNLYVIPVSEEAIEYLRGLNMPSVVQPSLIKDTILILSGIFICLVLTLLYLLTIITILKR